MCCVSARHYSIGSLDALPPPLPVHLSVYPPLFPLFGIRYLLLTVYDSILCVWGGEAC